MINEEIQLNVEKLKTESEYSCTRIQPQAASCKLKAVSKYSCTLYIARSTLHAMQPQAASEYGCPLHCMLHEDPVKLQANTD